MDRPYPNLISNVLKLFADFQVIVVVVIGLVLRIDPADFEDEAVSRAFYGDAMFVLLILTVVPVLVALLYRSPLERTISLLQKAALVDADSSSDLSLRRQGLRKKPSVVVSMTEPQPWGISLKTRKKQVVVSAVEPNSAADKAGLEVGMVLMSVAGTRVYDSMTAMKLGASSAVPTQLGFDATGSENVTIRHALAGQRPRHQELASEPEPEAESKYQHASAASVVDPEETAGVASSDTGAEDVQIEIGCDDSGDIDKVAEPAMSVHSKPISLAKPQAQHHDIALELSPVQMSELRKRSADVGATQDTTEESMDTTHPEQDRQAPRKYSDIAAVRQAAQARALSLELSQLPMPELRKRAADAGATQDAIQDAEEACDGEMPKDAMIAVNVPAAAQAENKPDISP